MIDKTKALLFERQAEIAKAVAHPLRIAVLDFLKDGLKVFYTLKTPCVADFLGCACRVLKQQARDNEKLLAAL